MKSLKIRYIGFLLAGLVIVVAGGFLLQSPGYMDAEYYYATSIQLADGKGFNQPFLWNYLDNIKGLPAPSFTFWMPLVSILSAPGYALFHTFVGARLILWLAAALIPAVTVYIGLKIHGQMKLAALGGIFALFPAYYLVYLPTTDAFGLYMLLGSLFLIIACRNNTGSTVTPFLIGGVAGLLHMTRADGILWLAGGLFWIFWQWAWGGSRSRQGLVGLIFSVLLCMAGYLVISSTWYVRNLMVFGGLFPPGGSKTLWLTQYEDLFVFPAAQLTFSRWWEMGFPQIITGWGQALWGNFQTTVAVQGAIALTPFIIIGMLKLRRQPIVRLGVGMWLISLLVFTFVFPNQGINGSFFHSGAAFQPLFWALAPIGIAVCVETIARWRKWERGAQVQRFVSVLLVITCVLLSIGLFYQKLKGNSENPAWGADEQQYARVDEALRDLGATPCELVMANNPPGYYLASGRPAVVIPYGDETMLLAAAAKNGVSYLALDKNNAGHLARLYLEPGPYPGLKYLTSVGDTRLYEFTR